MFRFGYPPSFLMMSVRCTSIWSGILRGSWVSGPVTSMSHADILPYFSFISCQIAFRERAIGTWKSESIRKSLNRRHKVQHSEDYELCISLKEKPVLSWQCFAELTPDRQDRDYSAFIIHNIPLPGFYGKGKTKEAGEAAFNSSLGGYLCIWQGINP